MRELKASTKEGQRIISIGERCVNETLSDIYASWSSEKQRHYDRCRKLYHETTGGHSFGVASCGSWSFVASWNGYKDGEPILRVETKDNSYLVWCDR